MDDDEGFRFYREENIAHFHLPRVPDGADMGRVPTWLIHLPPHASPEIGHPSSSSSTSSTSSSSSSSLSSHPPTCDHSSGQHQTAATHIFRRQPDDSSSDKHNQMTACNQCSMSLPLPPDSTLTSNRHASKCWGEAMPLEVVHFMAMMAVGRGSVLV
ncbi:hypothetical protein TcWFU_000866 [Taenia crassiceps]|uniref:Uncharacterized protein n=1 Tax=Taenia crassiceps TaxID=6207 RepID=A0ABR4Q9Z2_9CEST